jgi:hypothetical protein
MAIKKTVFQGKIENAHKKPLSSYKDAQGNPLPAVVPYEAEFDEFENIEDVKAAGEMPNEQDMVDTANEKRKAAARAKKIAETLTALGIVKPNLENDPQERLRKMVEVLVKNGEEPAAARLIASQVLKIDWE